MLSVDGDADAAAEYVRDEMNLDSLCLWLPIRMSHFLWERNYTEVVFRARLVLEWVTLGRYTLSWCVTSHSGQLSLLPSTLAKGQWNWSVAEKVTVGLTSHQPRVTASVVYLPVGWMA